MKKFLLLLMVGIILTTPSVFADDGGDEEIPQNPPEATDPPIYIPLPPPTSPPGQDPIPGEIKPRSLAPVEGWYENSCVEIFFSRNMGVAFVTVTNTNTGDMWYSAADSCDGVILVNINPTAGNYAITVETQFSSTYYGAFAL